MPGGSQLAHYPKPFFRPKRNCWYVQIDGHEHTLGPDESAARAEYHRLMAERGQEHGRPSRGGKLTTVELFTIFVTWCEKNRKPITFEQHRHYAKSFLRSIDSSRPVADLIPHDVTKWLDANPAWNAGGRIGAIATVKRAINWGIEQGLIDRNPLASIRKPRKGRREIVLTAEQVARVLDKCTDDNFRDLLAVAMETGARPMELRTAEARHIHENRIVFPMDEHKTGEKTGNARVIYLTDLAAVLVRKWAMKHPEGPIFRNARGNPWTRHCVRHRFDRMRKDKAIPRELCAYAFRHTFATDALTNGINPEELRILIGHADLTMICRHYSHLAGKKSHMEQAAERARGRKVS